jgi:hypothetical protein
MGKPTKLTEQDWIILRLAKALTPQFRQLTEQGQRDYTKAFIYLVKQYGADLILDSVDQLTKEAHEKTN